MTVLITKPAINLRGELASLKKPSGIVGESILRADTAADAVEQLNLEDHTFTTFTSTGIDDNATSTAVTIDGSRNVGIGTAAPSFYSGKLTVAGGNIAIEGGNRALFWNTGGSGVASIQGTDTNELSFSTSGSYTERMRIDSSGNVGIGTASPTDKLNISSSTNQIGLDTGNQAVYGTLDVGHFSNGAFIGTQAGSNAGSNLLRFGTSGTPRMTIDSSGNITVTGTVDGRDLSVDGTKLDGIAAASQVEAEAGTENTKFTTSLRVAQAIAAQAGAPTTAQVGTATAGLAVGAVGSYAFLRHFGDTLVILAGATKAGSTCYYTNAAGAESVSTSPSGTWRCMGHVYPVSNTPYRATVWLRIS